VRVVAALRRRGARLAIVRLLAATSLAVASLAWTGAARSTAAADPTAEPGPSAAGPTCAERYPGEGPAGVDLRLGCVIGELVGHYTGADAETVTPASTYALVTLAVIVGGGIAIWLVLRVARDAAGRRLAPVQPGEWWLCGSCRSVNGAGVEHCYSCGATRPDGPTLHTDEAPTTTQSFGSSRKRG